MSDLDIPGVGDATLIAAGGSALVYEALSGTGEPIAIKVLRGIRGAEITRRFEREQSAAERLSGHPHIMKINHTGLTGAGEPYLVMPLVAAGSLHDELERRGAFPLHQAVADVTVAAEAIEFAHGRGVLHRDIKPGNLLRSDDGAIIVTDFGIARVTDAGITSATVGATTPLYAAPELLAENEVSVQSEVYSLGALLYTLLHGTAAFSDSQNIWGTMHRVRTEVPAPIPGVPSPVMRVIQAAMAKEPVDRPQSAGQFAQYLATAMTAGDDWAPPILNGDRPVATQSTATKGKSASQNNRDSQTKRGTQSNSTSQSKNAGAPPVPAFDRPAPAMGAAPRAESASYKAIAGLIALILVAGLAWWGTTRLFSPSSVSSTAVETPTDNSLPSPDTASDDEQLEPAVSNESDSSADADEAAPDAGDDGNASDGDGEPRADAGAGSDSDASAVPLVSFSGDYFSAYLPEGWSVSSSDVDAGYGYRSTFVSSDMYLNVDTTPSELRPGGIDIAQSAREIAAGISSASPVRTEEIDGLVMHSFTFRNRQGVESIDIFFEVDGDGYAIVAGSASDPQAAFATARLVAGSIRSNPGQ